MKLSLAFHGGVGTVTGSKYLLTAGNTRVLVDCGMFQGLKELRLLNWQPTPFRPTTPDAVVLTHAHIDHTGYLPRLVQQGYRGPVYCTPATAELVRILLLDAAEIQEEDAAFANRQGYSKHKPALPLYTVKDAQAALRLLKTVDYREPLELGEGVTARFLNAGHILGSSFVQIDAESGDQSARLVFSGDLGRYHQPLHTDPDPLPECDALILESTYGDRLHEHRPLAEQIREAFAEPIARKGIILIPSFAVARAQLVTLILRELIETKRLPEIPIHIDSPMATDVTTLYNKYLESEYLDTRIPHTTPESLFPKNVRFHRSVADSKKLNNMDGPRIIIAASGMLTGGRVVHHLHRLVRDPRNLIALVGYQAAGTRGRSLLAGAQTIRMYGEDVPVRARVVSIEGLSAHADRDEILRWVGTAPKPPGTMFMTHGEPEASEALARAIKERFAIQPYIPEMGQSYDLSYLFR